jgi:hypothetical protein
MVLTNRQTIAARDTWVSYLFIGPIVLVAIDGGTHSYVCSHCQWFYGNDGRSMVLTVGVLGGI